MAAAPSRPTITVSTIGIVIHPSSENTTGTARRNIGPNSCRSVTSVGLVRRSMVEEEELVAYSLCGAGEFNLRRIGNPLPAAHSTATPPAGGRLTIGRRLNNLPHISGKVLWPFGLSSPLKFRSKLHPNLEVSPFGRRIGFLDMIREQSQASCREKNPSHFGVLLQLGAHGGNDEGVVIPLLARLVEHALALKGHPVNPELLHILFGGVARALGLECRHLRYIFARMRPGDLWRARPWIVRAFRIEHHLPEALDACISLSSKVERRGSEVREDAQFVALGKNHFAGLRGRRENLPDGPLALRNRRPPACGILIRRASLPRSQKRKISRQGYQPESGRGWRIAHGNEIENSIRTASQDDPEGESTSAPTQSPDQKARALCLFRSHKRLIGPCAVVLRATAST